MWSIVGTFRDVDVEIEFDSDGFGIFILNDDGSKGKEIPYEELTDKEIEDIQERIYDYLTREP